MMLPLWPDSAGIWENGKNDELDLYCRMEKVNRNDVLRWASSKENDTRAHRMEEKSIDDTTGESCSQGLFEK